MDVQQSELIEVVNRLKRGTVEGKVLWQKTGNPGTQFAAALDEGYSATVAAAPNGSSVIFVLSNSQRVTTVHLDSSRLADNLLRLALLQLYVAVRDEVARQIARDALGAVRAL